MEDQNSKLQEKCFRGTIATGFTVLMPYQDLPLDEGNDHGVDIEDNQPNTIDDDDEDSDEVGDNTQPSMVPSSLNVKKREEENGKRREKGMISREASIDP